MTCLLSCFMHRKLCSMSFAFSILHVNIMSHALGPSYCKLFRCTVLRRRSSPSRGGDMMTSSLLQRWTFNATFFLPPWPYFYVSHCFSMASWSGRGGGSRNNGTSSPQWGEVNEGSTYHAKSAFKVSVQVAEAQGLPVGTAAWPGQKGQRREQEPELRES